MNDNQKHIRRASEAMAALYTWASIQAILESGADPGRLDAESADASDTILEIVREQQQIALRIHDDSAKRIKS